MEDLDAEALQVAERSLKDLEISAYETSSKEVPFGAAAAIGMNLHRILQTVAEDQRTDGED